MFIMDTSELLDKAKSILGTVKGKASSFMQKDEGDSSERALAPKKGRKPKVVTLDSNQNFNMGKTDGVVVDLSPKKVNLNIFKIIFALIFGIVLIVVGMYAALSATIVRGVPLGGNTFAVTQSGTLEGGIPALDQQILADVGYIADNSTLGKLKQGFIGLNDPAILQVIGGPFGEVTVDPETKMLSYKGVPTTYTGDFPENSYMLNNQYLAFCLEGSCTGETVIIGSESITGEVTHKVVYEGGISFQVDKM